MRKRIGELAQKHGLSRFLTLTLDPAKLPEGADGAKFLRQVWAKFRTYLRRRCGRTVQFISVIEATQAGVAHLHILVDQYLEQHRISDAWSRLGGGRVVFIKQAHDLKRCGWYLGKYLTKEMISAGAGGLRRVTTSRGIRLQNADRIGRWELIYCPLDEVRRRTIDGEGEVLDERGQLKSFVSLWSFSEFGEDGNETVH